MSIRIKVGIGVLCLLGCVSSANAQYGVSNARDGYGNLIRDTGTNSIRNLPQPPVNNNSRPERTPQSSTPSNTTDHGRNVIR